MMQSTSSLPPEVSELQLPGRFVVRQLLAENDRSSVYLCVDEDAGRDVVIKHFHRDSGHLFLHEMSTNLELDHPRLLTSSETIYLSAGAGCIVYDYMRQGTLRDFLQTQGPLPVAECVACIEQLLTGLAHLHDKGFLHSDLKPENIYVEEGPEGLGYRIGDLGSAVRSKDPANGRIGVGTPAYAAPETLFKRQNLRSDLYSVGIIAFELFVGRLPFEGSVKQVQRAHIRGELHLELIHHSMYRGLVGVLTEKDVDARVESCKAALHVLSALHERSPRSEPVPCGTRDAEASTVDSDVYDLTLGAEPRGIAIMDRWPNRLLLVEYEHSLEVIRLGDECARTAYPKHGDAAFAADGTVLFRSAQQLLRLDAWAREVSTVQTLPVNATGFDCNEVALMWYDAAGYHLRRTGGHDAQSANMPADEVPRFARACRLTSNGGFAASEGAVNELVAFYDKSMQRYAEIRMPTAVLELIVAHRRLFAITLDPDGDDQYAFWHVDPEDGFTLLATSSPIVDWSDRGGMFLLLEDGDLLASVDRSIIKVDTLKTSNACAIAHSDCTTATLHHQYGARYTLRVASSQIKEAVA